MGISQETEQKLTELSRSLLTHPKYDMWRQNLDSQITDRWFSLIVEIGKTDRFLDVFDFCDEEIKSTLVYRCIKTPRYRDSGEIMVLFHVADMLWHSLIYFKRSP